MSINENENRVIKNRPQSPIGEEKNAEQLHTEETQQPMAGSLSVEMDVAAGPRKGRRKYWTLRRYLPSW